MSEGGASIHMKDPRLSKALAWLWGALGTGFVAGCWMVAQNLYQLNVTMSRVLDQSAQYATDIKDHEERIRTLERERRNEPRR